jgi:hypothetical protein
VSTARSGRGKLEVAIHHRANNLIVSPILGFALELKERSSRVVVDIGLLIEDIRQLVSVVQVDLE